MPSSCRTSLCFLPSGGTYTAAALAASMGSRPCHRHRAIMPLPPPRRVATSMTSACCTNCRLLIGGGWRSMRTYFSMRSRCDCSATRATAIVLERPTHLHMYPVPCTHHAPTADPSPHTHVHTSYTRRTHVVHTCTRAHVHTCTRARTHAHACTRAYVWHMHACTRYARHRSVGRLPPEKPMPAACSRPCPLLMDGPEPWSELGERESARELLNHWEIGELAQRSLLPLLIRKSAAVAHP